MSTQSSPKLVAALIALSCAILLICLLALANATPSSYTSRAHACPTAIASAIADGRVVGSVAVVTCR